jgi:hypothetical protein
VSGYNRDSPAMSQHLAYENFLQSRKEVHETEKLGIEFSQLLCVPCVGEYHAIDFLEMT